MLDRRPQLLVFLKNPQPGAVKTRLAATIGPEEAARLYRHWIALVLQQLQPLRNTVHLVGLFAGGGINDFQEWHTLVHDWREQSDGDLGRRLERAFETGHGLGSPVVAVGTDCLELSADLVSQAFAALSDHEAVFGPANDGGYYLVGTARPLPGFFTAIRWSSQHTLADHLARCRQHGWSVALLPVRHDIDTWEDWQAYLARQESRHVG
jgi:rSAM/selenodomain-associated transferase 1